MKTSHGNRFLSLLLFILLTLVTNSFCIDNANFHKAPRFHGSHQFKTKNWLAMFDASYANGSTRRGRNNIGDRTEAFDIYGHHNLLYLTSNVTKPSNIDSGISTIIDNIATTRTNFAALDLTETVSFGLVKFSGKFELDELPLNYRQNLKNNFFVELNIPFKRVKVSKIKYEDQSPSSGTTGSPYNQEDTSWMNFTHTTTFDEILKLYGLKGYQAGYKKTYPGDISVIFGWQKLITEPIVDFLEYVNFAIKGGILLPTGLNANPDHPFAIPTGYNGHFGIPLRIDAHFGLSNDIYLGTNLGITFFKNETHSKYPVKTDEKQQGFIKLYRCKVTEKKGTLFDIGVYLKLDHFFRGLSATTGYSYNRQARDHLTLKQNTSATNNLIIDSDSRLNGWRMHVLHFLADYDFSVHKFFQEKKWQPRIGAFYNYPFDGKNIFINPITGGSLGCDLTWNF